MAVEVGIPFPLKTNLKEPQEKLNWRVVAPGQYRAEGNHGLALFPSVLVLDFDPRNYPEGRDLFAEFLNRFPHLRATRIIQTPSGGYHVYLSKSVDFEVKKEQSKYPGVDHLSQKHYVCGEGTHIDYQKLDGTLCKGTYTVLVHGFVLPAPLDYLNELDQPAQPQTAGADESLLNEQTFKGECEHNAPAHQGSRGSTCYKLAARGRDLALSLDAAYKYISGYWAPRCTPPMPDKEVFESVSHAYTYAKNAAGAASPEAKFKTLAVDTNTTDKALDNVQSIVEYQSDQVMSKVHQKQVAYEKDLSTPKNTFGNVVFYLMNDNDWKGRLRYNQFADRIEMAGGFDWRKEFGHKHKGLTAFDSAWIRCWFSTNLAMEVDDKKIADACYVASKQYHPVREYLDGLKWDGVSRLKTFLHDTTGCANNDYTSNAGMCMMVSAVKRIYEPGCKQDYVLVLEHRQGKHKSQWVEALGGEWHSTGELLPGDKDTYQNLKGKWIVELPEMDGTYSKADYRWLKKIITTSYDTYRPSYAREAQTVPRESIFIATLNPNATGQYLTDEENRRYWPIQTGQINLALLKANRDQYFAEAIELYNQNADTSWMMSKEAAEIAEREQTARREIDPWVETLDGWANADQQADGFSSPEAFTALGFNGKDQNPRLRNRLYQVLRDLNFEYHRSHKKWFKQLDWGKLL
jgi:predicted P-loop ATPase